MAYAPERREAVLKKIVPVGAVSIAELARLEGISEQTLCGWCNQAQRDARPMPDTDLTPEGWTSRDKFAAVVETGALVAATELAEYCRAKGLHTKQIAAWRAACEQANETVIGRPARSYTQPVRR